MGTALQALQRTGPLTEAECELALRVLDDVLLGNSLEEIETAGGPSQRAVLGWLQRDKLFTQMYNRAREISSFAFENRVLALSDEMDQWKGNNPDRTRRRTAHIENLKWAARVRNPGVFSDKATVQVTVPIQIISNLDLGEQDAAKSTGNTYVIEATVNREITAGELPPNHTAIDLGDGHVGYVPKKEAFDAAADAEIVEGDGQPKTQRVRGIDRSRDPAAKAVSAVAKAARSKDISRPNSVANDAKRKAGKVAGEKAS